MKIIVNHVRIPAMSTVGILTGTDENGNTVTFALDHGPAYHIGQDVAAGEIVEIEPEPWMILSITDPNEPEFQGREVHA